MTAHGRVVTLTFHGIGPPSRRLDPGEEDTWIGQDLFTALLDAVVDARATGTDVAITFDDGNASDVEIALPALVRRGLTASFFIVADRLAEPAFVSGNDVYALASSGMTVGLHGLSHRPWRGIEAAELDRELAAGRGAVEAAAGARVTTAACPFGAYDRRVLAALRRSGFERVYTSDGGTTDRTRWLQARTSVRADDDAALLARIAADDRRTAARLRALARQTLKGWR
jgi:peptidoglycan/xylan/chitin deacetylase (PgdA/CDA1 family)